MLEKDLQSFLSLMFGQFIQFSMLEGHGSSANAPRCAVGDCVPALAEDGVSSRAKLVHQTHLPERL